MPFLSSELIHDVIGSRPAAGSAGRLFFSSDESKTYRDNGSSWDDVSDAGIVLSVAGRTGAVVLAETDLSFTNITTNDVSTSKHGFAPLLPNDATKFLNGVGTYTVPPGTSAVPSFADNETPSGTVNSSNVTFTLAHTPSPSASLILARQGVIQIAGTDFTLSTATITFIIAAPITGDLLTAWYRY